MIPAMRAVGYHENLAVEDPASLVDVTVPVPEPGPHDLLVRVRAVSVNPVDTKIRRGRPADGVRILGFDAAGTVEAIGADVTRFGVGDDVYYAGSSDRRGSNAELQLVDEHIVGRKPATLDFAQAAAMPLTTITAWEGLFDHLALTPGSIGTLVAVSAAGGVGSMVTQLARTQTRLTVIGTASRPESAAFAAALRGSAFPPVGPSVNSRTSRSLASGSISSKVSPPDVTSGTRVGLYVLAAVVVGRTRMSARYEDQPWSAASRYTHVLVECGGVWRLASAQGRPVAG